jgi:hypothetical protein
LNIVKKRKNFFMLQEGDAIDLTRYVAKGAVDW